LDLNIREAVNSFNIQSKSIIIYFTPIQKISLSWYSNINTMYIRGLSHAVSSQ
jgi:hypothetical protein